MASFIAAGAEWRGIPQSRLHQDRDLLVTTLLGLSAELGLDGAYLSSDNWIVHAALGGDVEFPPDDEPRSARPVLDEWDKLDDLRVPDPARAPRMSFMLAAARQAATHNPHDLFLEANIDSGAFQMAGILRGAEQLMLDVVLEPEKVHRLLDFCCRVAQAYGAAMAATGVDAVQFGDSTASLVSRAMYTEFVEPYQAPVTAAIRRAGAYPFLHVCGNSSHLSERLPASGAACVEIDGPANLAQALAAFGGRIALRGNIPTPLLREGLPEQVFQHARACLEVARGHRFILSPGCGVPRGTPLNNIRALVRAAAGGRHRASAA
jgi:MtaA/CmuA family methyltransferase